MRIALFAETYLPYINGVVTHVKVLKDGLTALGHQVMIVTTDPKAKKHYLKDGVLHCPAHSFKKKELYGYSVSSLYSRVRMKYLKAFRPDVLHMHQEFSMGIFAAYAAKRLKKPLVYTLHTMYDEYIFYIAPDLFVPAMRSVSHRYAHILAKQADAITSPSAKAKEFLEKCHVKKPVEIIPNSIDYEEFDPDRFSPEQIAGIREQLAIPKEATAGVFVGRLGREKSVHLLLDYWADYFKEEKTLRLVIIGDGPEQEPLKKQAKDLGIGEQVTFTGSIPHEQIPPYFMACDFFITASITEMMSISMLEGMASGLPAVLRFDPLNAGQVQEGVNGYTYRNPEQMAEIVRKLAGMSLEEKREMRAQVRESIKDKGAKDLANYMLGVYSRVTGIPV